MGDRASIPEMEMIKQMWNGADKPPKTEAPEIVSASGGVKISTKTKGASIGYRIVKKGDDQKTEMHTIQSWDAAYVTNAIKNGGKRIAAPVWQVYKGGVIPVNSGDTLKVNAMRIGYKPALADYIDGKTIPVAAVSRANDD